MKHLLLFVLLLLPGSVLARQSDERPVSSSITRATVYLSGAQVTREARVNLPAGSSSLVFTGLTSNLDPSSIQLDAEGRFTVLSVSHRMNYEDPAGPSPEVEQLQERRTAKEDSLALLTTTLQVYEQEEQLLLSNKEIGGTDGVQTVELRNAADFFRERLLEIKARQLTLRRQIRRLQGDIALIDAQIGEIRSGGRNRTSSEVVVAVSAAAATRGDFSLSYVTAAAGWSPRYDLRVEEVGTPIEWTYNANVSQSTGEDWRDVLLTLSTGNPHESGMRPELYPWPIGFYEPPRYYDRTAAQRRSRSMMPGRVVPGAPVSNPGRLAGAIRDAGTGEPLPGATVMLDGSTLGAVTDMDGNYTLHGIPPGAWQVRASFVGYGTVVAALTSDRMDFYLPEEVIRGEEVVVTAERPEAPGLESAADAPPPVPTTVTQNATTVEFDIAVPYSIPSDGKPRVVAIQAFTVPAQYEYFTAPKVDPNAYLTARVTDWAQYNLLSGEANLFFGGTFVGRTYLDAQNLTDTLTVSLGRDAGIVVERREREDYTQRRLLGSRTEETHAFEIQVRNNKRVPVRVLVQDQIPVSTTNQIEVESRIGSGGALNEDTGIITWRLDVPAASTKSVAFSYEVEYPRGRTVVLE